MKVVVGKIAVPTPDQESRAMLTGGWQEKKINGKTVLWNACVSKPFGNADYEF
jgi:hypothetical protein